MALYVSVGQRRRRIFVTAGIAALVALIVGVGIGRITAPQPSVEAREAKKIARVVTGQLQALPLHYEQASRGELDRDTFRQSLDAGLERARNDLNAAMNRAAWLDPLVRQALIESVADIQAIAEADGTPEDFAEAVRRATDQIDVAFGTLPANAD